ncbi:kinase-like domain-containing protein [Chytridium lagenaria]|nr:kinase-like domain-containing protein [Chytridium lagenaria]
MVVSVSVLLATAKTFYDIYMLCEQRRANDASVTLLKDRIEALVANVEALSQSSDTVETAFQATQDLVRRLQAAISSARMIIERYAEANTFKRIAFSGGHKEGLVNVSNELNGCAADLNLLMAIRFFAKAETREARKIREESLAVELKSFQNKFNAALKEDANNHKALAREIQKISASNQQNKTDVFRQAKELTDGIHDHLNIMHKGFHKALKVMSVVNVKSIRKNDVQNYSPIHMGRHIVELCEYVDGDSSVPCVFKYINPGKSRVIFYHQVDNSATEVAVLSALGMHPYFPKLFGKFERDPNSVGILMEYVGEDKRSLSLREYLTNNIIEWSERLRFMRQLVSAIAYMHKAGIVHGGLNSEDILVRVDPEFGSSIKIIDFDRAIIVAAETPYSISDIDSRMLEHPYFAPEVHSGAQPSYSTDIFAVGTLLWELAYCTIPYDHIPPETVASLILSGQRDGLPSGSRTGPPTELVEVIYRCWSQHPSLRPTAQDLDDATFDIYRCDMATATLPSRVSTLQEWRDEYLCIRSGLSCEDVVCIRVIAWFWIDDRLHTSYLPSDPSARKLIALKWLQFAVDRYDSGGAAYEIARKFYGGVGDEEGRKWLLKAKDLGHPASIKEVAYYQYKVEKVLTKRQYEAIGAEMQYLCRVRDSLLMQKEFQRKGITVF